jgi:prepilin-type N-terminal cleavage/methylation domain-containing protein
MSRRRAFTLVELLVVIAIIAVLIALLLPVAKAVRRQVDKVVCASNLRQIGVAFLMYAQDHKGGMPAGANQRGVFTRYYPEDWVHWQADRDITRSALWPYLRSTKVLVCPSGIPSRDPAYVYPFSYSLNHYMSGGADGQGHCNLKRVVQPWHKLMVIEENSLTINDGTWEGGAQTPYPGMPPGEEVGILSARHDLAHEYDRPQGMPYWSTHYFGSGHGVCADGSVAFLKRWDAFHDYWHDPYQIGPPSKPPNPGGL